MNRRTVDLAVGFALAILLAGGGLLTWQALQRRQSTAGMMDSMMGSSSMHGTDPLVYVFGTLVAAAVLGGGYLFYRRSPPDHTTAPTTDGGADARDPAPEFGTVSAPEDTEYSASAPEDTEPVDAGRSDEEATRRLLEVLPEDERRVLEPVVDSPGITQIALRDRSDFSKSKVSQTVSELEKRGLLYREKQGRTYRVYPSDDLGDRLDTPS